MMKCPIKLWFNVKNPFLERSKTANFVDLFFWDPNWSKLIILLLSKYFVSFVSLSFSYSPLNIGVIIANFIWYGKTLKQNFCWKYYFGFQILQERVLSGILVTYHICYVICFCQVTLLFFQFLTYWWVARTLNLVVLSPKICG